MKKTVVLWAFFYTLFILPVSSFAYPEGQLYWAVEEYPTVFHLYYNNTDTYNGAEPAINYACQQSPGIGIYSGKVRMLNSSENYPAQKTGYCQNTRPLVPGKFDGAMYTAYLHCNGVKREQMDDAPCVQTPFDPDHNLGVCPIK